MTSVNDDVPDHVLALLGRLMESVRDEVLAEGLPGGLRTSQLRMLSLTPAEGLRVTDLAARVGMTKQALGEFATELEKGGLLETVRDPADRRVRILRPTARARQALDRAAEAIGRIESRRRERMGADWDELLDLLRVALRTSGPDSSGP